MQNTISHVIFDLDGLLLNTEPFYTQVSQTIAGRYGKVFDWSIKSRMIGRRALESAKIFTETLELPLSPLEYLEERSALLDQLFPMAEPMPGAQRLTQHLSRHNIPQAVATSSDRRHFELKTRRHKEWFKVFQCCVSGDESAVNQGKPAPDIFLVTASRLGAEPEHCLVFEDSPAGVEAARAAGMFVVAVPDPAMNRSAYMKAHSVINTLDDFDPGEWNLPRYSEA